MSASSADTHDNRPAIRKAVDVFNQRGVGLVVHAGDMISPFTILDFKKLPLPWKSFSAIMTESVWGCAARYRENAKLLPGPREFTFGGRRFLLMHEDGCVAAAAQSEAVDIIVSGHTHDIDVRQGPPLVLNPGEAGGWLRGRSTVQLWIWPRLMSEISIWRSKALNTLQNNFIANHIRHMPYVNRFTNLLFQPSKQAQHQHFNDNNNSPRTHTEYFRQGFLTKGAFG